LGRNDTHGNCIDHWDWPARLDLWILVELGRAANAQDNIIVADAIKLDRRRGLLHAPELKEDKLFLCVLARVDNRVAGVEYTLSLLELLI